jgi:hypothetical protein
MQYSLNKNIRHLYCERKAVKSLFGLFVLYVKFFICHNKDT